jgi:hypothetical protein
MTNSHIVLGLIVCIMFTYIIGSNYNPRKELVDDIETNITTIKQPSNLELSIKLDSILSIISNNKTK